MDLAAQARHIRQQVARRRGRQPFAPALTAQVRAHVKARRATGDSMDQIAKDLGISFDTLYRWRREAPLLRQVQVIAEEPQAAFTVHGPGGLRIEGLDLAALAELLRCLR